MYEEIIVLKLGSSVLETLEDIPNAIHEIYRWYREGYKVVVIVSAIGETTEHLIAQSRKVSDAPDPWASAELLATGERSAAALLSMALDRAGVRARIVDPREIQLTVSGSPLDSKPVSVDASRLRGLLSNYPVIVIPGFFGNASDDRVQLLGRGGSDLSAVFLAHRLNAAHCRLIKDVDGVYDADPALACERNPRRFACLSYEDAVRVAGRLIQPKAVAYLQTHGISADVAAHAMPYESRVHRGATQLGAGSASRPLRVLLLGLGTVGRGIYQRLTANPQHFEVRGALVRNRARHEALGVPSEILITNIEELGATEIDLAIDVLSGVEVSKRLVEQLLSCGVDVVSANKSLIAECGVALTATAARSGAVLCYSASVGGGAPMIETVDRIAARHSLAAMGAVLNGTCNFVLDWCCCGMLEEAVAEAKHRGFAEQDLTDDLLGCDAARKLAILARHGFGGHLQGIEMEPLNESVADRAREAAAAGMRLRQIARAWRDGIVIRGAVKFEAVAADSFLGRLAQECNGLEIQCTDGQQVFVTGRGAGRWPTTEAVMADSYAIRRLRWSRNGDTTRGARRVILAATS